jgi:hypothetical protein
VLKIREISGRKSAKYERLNMLTGTLVLTIPLSTGFLYLKKTSDADFSEALQGLRPGFTETSRPTHSTQQSCSA